MEKYKYSKKELDCMENSCLPFAVYQFIDNHVETIVISKGFIELFNLSEDIKSVYELMNNDMYRDCHPDDIAVIEDAAVRFATKDVPYNVIYRSKINGEYRIIHAFGKHIYKDTVRLAVVWYVDEGVVKSESELENNSLNSYFSKCLFIDNSDNRINYDYLTGLPTISYFFYLVDTNYYKETIKKHKVPVMLFCDLNGMQYFNAKYGFAEGDSLIRAFSRLLAETFSSEKCCRFGMDRFCVYTENIKLENRLWKLFNDCENINGGKSLPVRVGIYSTQIDNCSASLACDRAKLACDSSKSFPLSHFTYFDESMLKDAENRQYIIDNIDKAIENKWIKVFYQPIIRAASGLVCDEEALSRWIDPVKGFMNPAEFIPVLEDANLIYKLDLFVTEEILEKMKKQDDKGLYVVPISVNLSRSDFHTCDIVGEIYKRVEASGIPPEKLTIEITESIIGKDFDYMKSQIKRFHSLGFRVWMDDFGSGYSSLDVLHDIPFNLIKFDMKFMQQFDKNEKSKIILSGLIKTALDLGIETICEGVETKEQTEFLKEVGCTKLQGYYYCQPIPYEKIFERYDQGKQIGFENPSEAHYYECIGKINLYDFSSIANSNDVFLQNFFNTMPMSVLEIDGKELRIVRGNNTYRKFLKRYHLNLSYDMKHDFSKQYDNMESVFMTSIQKCSMSSEPFIIDETLNDGTQIHVYIKRIAINPVTDVVAIVTVILGLNKLS